MKKKILIPITTIIVFLLLMCIPMFNVTNKELEENNVEYIEEKDKEDKVEDIVPSELKDNGIFSEYYELAYSKLQTLSLEEKIGQLLIVRYPDTNQIEILKKYKLGGFVFFKKDFTDKNEVQVKNMIQTLQNNSKIPLLTAVDEEGGSVVRISSNSKLVDKKYKSPSELYKKGGFDLIKQDTIDKSRVLNNLGLNLNLAPVVDVCTSSKDYMYSRALKQNTELTSKYAQVVIEASKSTGVSYTLKHFPGYGSNLDTHKTSSVDKRSYNELVEKDLPPFKAGIEVGAEAILVSHNIVNSIDSKNPASISINIHNLLRDDLGFTGIIITDDIAMNAVSDISDVSVKAILARNDLIITTDYEDSFNAIKLAVENTTITEKQIDKACFRVLAWKYYKSLINDL